MSLYTMRNNLRKHHNGVDISEGVYTAALVLCKKYYMNLALKYPYNYLNSNKVYDLRLELCEKTDVDKFLSDVKIQIPELYIKNGEILFPANKINFKSPFLHYELFDYIEFIANNIHDIEKVKFSDLSPHYEWYRDELKEYMSKYQCDEFIFFRHTDIIFKTFQKEINKLFKDNGLLYILVNYKIIERVVDNNVASDEIVKQISQVPEKGTKELLQEAIRLYRMPHPNDRKTAVDVLWKALERLKSYYYSETNNKKNLSADMLISKMSDSQEEYIQLFNKEFNELRYIGNNFTIRHGEVDKTEITDPRHYDYFFNRCLSLIALAIQYLK